MELAEGNIELPLALCSVRVAVVDDDDDVEGDDACVGGTVDVDAEQRPVAHLLLPSRPESLNVFINHVPSSASSSLGILHLMPLLFEAATLFCNRNLQRENHRQHLQPEIVSIIDHSGYFHEQ